MKKKLVLILALLSAISCAQDKNPDADDQGQTAIDLEKKVNLEYVWICNHPQTKFHNKVCVEDIYPKGCFVSGDSSKFCWILTASDCRGELLYDWQINNCHLLRGE